VGPDFRVGPGDVIAINVWKEPDVSTSVLIRPDGKISLPLVNDLEVTGRTPMEIQSLVTEKLSPFINDPNVTVTVTQINSKKVFVMGQVGRTGAYPVLEPTTVLQILTLAGGLAPFANQKGIYILRMKDGKQEKLPFNYKDVVKGERMEQNILLQPGDTVVVP
jgi:polysaccharide export outer membrane protein